MKKIMICFLGLLCFTAYSQNISPERAKEIFGARFISAKEAGFSEKLEIPYTEDQTRYDKISWLIPILIHKRPEYRMIQARFILNVYEENDTLGLKETIEAIKVLGKTKFPVEGSKKKEPFRYFYITKDPAPTKLGMIYRKAIAYDDSTNIIVDLPISARSGILGPRDITYFIENVPGQMFMGFEPLPKGSPQIEELYVYILTMVYIKPIK